MSQRIELFMMLRTALENVGGEPLLPPEMENQLVKICFNM
jgi:hypothetical protein